MGHFLFQSMF